MRYKGVNFKATNTRNIHPISSSTATNDKNTQFFLFFQGANLNQPINCNRLSHITERKRRDPHPKKSKKNKRQSIGKAFVKRQKYKSGGEIRFNNNASSHLIFVIHVVFPSRVEDDDFDE